MHKNIVVAPVGDNLEAIFVGIRDFPTRKLILLATKKNENLAKKIVKEMDKFRIDTQIRSMEGNMWEAFFAEISRIRSVEGEDNIVINTSSGDRTSQCALTSAAFVNGVKAFAVEDNETMLLPILKFSYYKVLTDKKMEILRFLYKERSCCASLEELSKKTEMSLPLISYHINGTPKSQGLKKLGLVEVDEKRGSTGVSLSTMGILLLKGYVDQ